MKFDLPSFVRLPKKIREPSSKKKEEATKMLVGCTTTLLNAMNIIIKNEITKKTTKNATTFSFQNKKRKDKPPDGPLAA